MTSSAEDIPAWERRQAARLMIANLTSKARSLRLQSCRASPMLSRQLVALAEQYERRATELRATAA